MQNVYSVQSSDNPEIIRLAEALRESGIPEGYEDYYVSDSGLPFFKIPKAYKKEHEGDADFHYIYIDVDTRGESVEYTVTMVYTSVHINNLEDCVSLCEGLYNQRFCEVAIVTPIGLAGGFAIHTGDHEENVRTLLNKADEIFPRLSELGRSGALVRGHVHMLFSGGLLLNSINYAPAGDFQYSGIKVYAASYICAEHPEIYVLQQ